MTDHGGPRELKRLERAEGTSVAVAGELLAYLLSGAVEAGTRLPSERELAERLGVGRSAVREALKPLALLGLVDVRQGNGTFFHGTDSALLPRVIEWGLLLGERTVSDLVEARRPIEVALAGFAAQRRTTEQLTRLRAELEKMRVTAETEAFSEADTNFHLCIAEASGNGVLSSILMSIRELLRAWVRTVVDNMPDNTPLYDEHMAIYRAIEAREVAAASAAMDLHMNAVQNRLHAGVATTRARAGDLAI